MGQATLSELKVTLRSKEHQLTKAREKIELLSYECRTLRDALAIQDREKTEQTFDNVIDGQYNSSSIWYSTQEAKACTTS